MKYVVSDFLQENVILICDKIKYATNLYNLLKYHYKNMEYTHTHTYVGFYLSLH